MPTSNKPVRRFLTIDQVAEELSVGLPQVRALLRSGDLRGLQIGPRGLWRVGVDDFENYIAEAYRYTAERIASGSIDVSPKDDEAPDLG